MRQLKKTVGYSEVGEASTMKPLAKVLKTASCR